MKLINLNQIPEDKKIIITDDMVTVYYLKFAKDEGIPHHTKNGIGIIHVLEGRILIKFDTGESYEIGKDELLEFKASIIHTLKAIENTRLLLINASYSN